MSARPDSVSSSVFVKSEPVEESIPGRNSQYDANDDDDHDHDDDDDDPIIRSIDVYISPQLSSTLHLLQFPIQSALTSKRASNNNSSNNSSNSNNNNNRNNNASYNDTPTSAKIRPKRCMLELEYPIPNAAKSATRQLPDTMCMSERTFTSNAIAPVTHMALAKLDKSGTRLDVIPLTRKVLQMRPSFKHLHMYDDEDEDGAAASAAAVAAAAASAATLEGADAASADNKTATTTPGRQKPILFQKKETERSANARRNSYAYHRALEESEEWVELDVHDASYPSSVRRELWKQIACPNREEGIQLATSANGGGYVRSLNYLDSISALRSNNDGSSFVENLSEWSAVAAMARSATQEAATTKGLDVDMVGEEDEDEYATSTAKATATRASVSIGATEQATAELASKLAILLQNGNGTMVPYRVIRSRFHMDKVSDDILTMALSSCAVLVRGNFALKSNLAQFINGGESRRKLMRELRDLILLLLNMHGMIQRERLIHTYKAIATKEDGNDNYAKVITPESITFVLETIAKKSTDCWVAKVEDDEDFAGKFPKVAACHGVYWLKKASMMKELVGLYETAGDEIMDDFNV